MKINNYKYKEIIVSFLNSSIFINFFAFLLGILILGLIVLLLGYSPLRMYYIMIEVIFSSPKHFGYIISYATPLIFTGLSIGIALKVGLFNIGVESQFMLGSISALIAGIFLDFSPLLHVICIFIFAFLASGILGILIGYLKIKFNINEVISGIMFNWILFHVNNLIIDLPAIKKNNSDLSKPIRESAFIDFFGSWKLSSEGLAYRAEHPFINDLLKAPLNFGIVIGIIIAILMWILLNKTMLGFKISAVGHNIVASYRVGIDIKKILLFAMFLAGALAGLAGAIQVMGVTKAIFKLSYMEGTGLNGIAVALIGNNSPIGMIFSSTLFSILLYGSSRVQSLMGLSSSIVSLMIGIVVIVISASHFLNKIVLGGIKSVKRNNISN
ncbi:ABC transporter permease protein [Borrelia nietonii YOR]|uniref:ABC transporter permease protein n=1 Tax=Borrelia nietonii YOR TaxID=1293576 RepID=A0ABM5PHY3_9SPIR|nr:MULTISPECIES: ABC transporter permease [Borrelia]AHH03674.1 ABC transporter permease protein [Borrelia nietonii YOR]AHH14173.1 ABC transporter permease protein [Borrelia hermsii MTW]UPA09363.1 ABC transporter permease [Borrelia nietonii YOR]